MIIDLNLDKEFIGKKIIVTGASRGLGAAICKTLANKGAELVMMSRSKDEMENCSRTWKPYRTIFSWYLWKVSDGSWNRDKEYL